MLCTGQKFADVSTITAASIFGIGKEEGTTSTDSQHLVPQNS